MGSWGSIAWPEATRVHLVWCRGGHAFSMHSVDRLTVRITREWIEYTSVPFAVLRTSNE